MEKLGIGSEALPPTAFQKSEKNWSASVKFQYVCRALATLHCACTASHLPPAQGAAPKASMGMTQDALPRHSPSTTACELGAWQAPRL